MAQQLMDQEFEIFKDYLQTHQLRLTPQRKIILQEMLKNEGHMESREVYDLVKTIDETIGIATVYRTINLLVECGLIRETMMPNGKKVYESESNQGHHDHLICNQCGWIEEFEHPLIEKFQEEIARRHRFTLQSHRMVLVGICKQCGRV